MQSGSINLAMALTGGLVTWAKPLVFADWAQDGYGATGSIDDLSDRVGRPIEIVHYLDDGLPNEVTFASGLGTPDLSVPLVGGGSVYETVILDSFGRDETNTWGRADTHQVWVLSSTGGLSNFSVAGGYGRHAMTAINSSRWSTIPIQQTNGSIRATVGTDVLATGGSHFLAVAYRFIDTNNTYLARLEFTTTQGVNLTLRKRVGGTETLIGTTFDTGLTHVPGMQYGVELSCQGSTLSAKAWRVVDPDTDAIPTDWMITQTDTSLTTAGSAGVRSILSTANTNTLPVTSTWGTPRVTGYDTPGVYISAAKYFSPFRTDSPVYSFARDVAPVKIDVQTVTSSGLESVRIFTGQMTSTPTDGQSAALKAMSASRLKLAKLVQLPVRPRVGADYIGFPESGLTAAWPVTWAMHQCQVYPSPPAASGCRYWAPLHGGGHSYLPSSNTRIALAPFVGYLSTTGAQNPSTPVTIDGPYVGGMLGQVGSSYRFVKADPIEGAMEDGSEWLTKTANRGRFEFWLRGDTTSINSVPGGSGEVVVGLAEVFAGAPHIMAGIDFNYDDNICLVAGIRATDRVPIISIDDGTATSTAIGSAAVPTDGAWHFYGFAWDIAAKKLWINIDGTVTATNASSASTANLPTDQWGDASTLTMGSGLPVSEVQFSTGSPASHDLYPTWMYNSNWTRGASATISILELVALNEPPREAWELIGRYAQAELAQFRSDENDTVLYLPMPYWARTAQQTTLQTLSARRDSKPPRVTYDASKIRNSVRLGYSQTGIYLGSTYLPLLELNTPLPMPPGVTRYLLALTTPSHKLFPLTAEIPVLTEDQVDGTDTSLPFAQAYHYISYNTEPDGSGTYPSVDSVTKLAAQLHATIEEWAADQILLKLENTTATTYYVTNNSASFGVNRAFLSVGGFPIITNTGAFVTASDSTSIATRGERGLPLQSDVIQTEAMAQQMAEILVGDLAYPMPVVENLELFGDPRRQPGDLVSYSDPDGTGVSGLWRLRGIRHMVNAAEYTQLTTLRRARKTGTWDSGIWGDCIWGE